MKHHFTKTVLLASVCIFAYGANPASCATNDTTACAASKEEREIEEAIAKAPEMILSPTNNVSEYISMVSGKIQKWQSPETRYRYFRKLMEKACEVDFGKIVENAPEKKMPDETHGFLIWSGMYGDPKLGAFWDAYRRLSRMADEIWETLTSSYATAACVEQFEPYFKLIEKLNYEGKRLEKSLPSLKQTRREELEFVANRIERRFYFTYLQNLCESPDLQGVARFKERFRRVVGRPIRTEEEYRADSRRKVKDFIKKREEGK